MNHVLVFNQFRIPRVIIHQILQSDLIILVQELSSNDHRMRVQFCRWAINILEYDPEFFGMFRFGNIP